MKTIVSQRKQGTFEQDALPDTGCTRSIVALDVIQRNNLTYDHSYNGKLFDASGSEMTVHGLITIDVKPKYVNNIENGSGEAVPVTAVVTSSLKGDLWLSWHDLIKLGCLPCNFPSVNTEDSCRGVSNEEANAGGARGIYKTIDLSLIHI